MMSALAPLAIALQNPPPGLEPYLPLVRRVLHGGGQCVAEKLNAAREDSARFVSFVAHSALPPHEAYEAFIARTGCVPTRDNLHDLFNGLVWLTYPQSKRCMNELQAQHIALHGTSGPRGPLRDALTVFDENAAVLQAPAELVDALRRRDWNALFVAHRARWQSARFIVFGHALMEKLLHPRKAITAHAWVLEELSDSALVSTLTPERLSVKPFLPLPLLGVPGWWSANEDPAFYDDPEVFRRAR